MPKRNRKAPEGLISGAFRLPLRTIHFILPTGIIAYAFWCFKYSRMSNLAIQTATQNVIHLEVNSKRITKNLVCRFHFFIFRCYFRGCGMLPMIQGLGVSQQALFVVCRTNRLLAFLRKNVTGNDCKPSCFLGL